MNRVSKRQAVNIQILDKLLDYARKNPDQRFGQILRNTGAIAEQELEFVPDNSRPHLKHTELVWQNGFNEEPWDTLNRMVQNE